jgi:hypothetical protein
MPEIAACLNAAASRILNTVVILHSPRKKIKRDTRDALLNAIQAVGDDANLLVVSLDGSVMAPRQIFGHRGLRHGNPQFEQFSVNARCTPQGVCLAHAPN